MAMVTGEHSPRKKRFSEWTNPSLIAVGVILILLGLPMTLWLMTYPSRPAVVMWVVTWLSLTFFILWMVKKSATDPGYKIDKKIVKKTEEELTTERRKVRKELLANEINALGRGEKTPVLDVWRLDESLAARHDFFRQTTALLIDPWVRELQIKIQCGEMKKTDENRKFLISSTLKQLSAYFRLIAQDPYLLAERTFFDRVILEIDCIREDERHVDISYPTMSFSIEAPVFWSIASMPEFSVSHLQKIADTRFDDGKEIVPHSAIDLPAARGIT